MLGVSPAGYYAWRSRPVGVIPDKLEGITSANALLPIDPRPVHLTYGRRQALYHLGFSQFRDLAGAEAEFGEEFLSLLAEFRRRRHHLAGGARQLEGLAD